MHLSSLPLCAYLSSDASCLALCLHCGCAELTFLLRCSSFCVDIHINYSDCQEHLSGVTTLLSTVSPSVSLLMTSSELENRHMGSVFTHSLRHIRIKRRPVSISPRQGGVKGLETGVQTGRSRQEEHEGEGSGAGAVKCLELGSVACQTLPWRIG